MECGHGDHATVLCSEQRVLHLAMDVRESEGGVHEGDPRLARRLAAVAVDHNSKVNQHVGKIGVPANSPEMVSGVW